MIKTKGGMIVGGSNFWGVDTTFIGSGAKKTFDQIIKSLFANNEQGFFYDPNDLSTMYQDAAGTVPVTEAGQPVGLMLDKSKGLVLGPELVVNGDFTVDGSGWGAWGSPILSYANGQVTISSDIGTGSRGIHQDINVPVGKWVEIKCKIKTLTGTSAFSVRDGGSFNTTRLNLTIPITEKLAEYKAYVKSDTGSIRIYLPVNNLSSSVVDSVSCKIIEGNHAYQITSAARPILRKNAVTGANYLEFDGSDDFLQTANIDFTGTDKVSLFVGQKTNVPSSLGSLVETGSNYSNPTGGFGLYAPSGSTSVGSLPTVGGGLSGGGGFFAFGQILANNFTSTISLRADLSKALKTDQARISVNGESKVPTASSAVVAGSKFSTAPVFIGRRGGVSLPFNGHIYGIIGIGKLASDDETTTIEKELAKRAGVTLNV